MHSFSISSLSLPGRVAARSSVSRRVKQAPRAKRVAPATCHGGGNFNDGSGFGGGSGGGSNGGSGGSGGDDCDDDCPIDWRWNPRVNALALTVASATLSHAPNALAGKKGGKPDPKDLIDKVDFSELTKLFGTEFGISGVVGLGVGILGKTVAKFSVMILASVYAFLRWLELNDIIDVKWKNLERLVGKTSKIVLDVNKDGKIDEKDPTPRRPRRSDSCRPRAVRGGSRRGDHARPPHRLTVDAKF